MTGSRIPRRKPPKRRNLEEAEACLVSMVGFGEAAVTCAKPLVDDVMCMPSCLGQLLHQRSKAAKRTDKQA
ncbi:hypothetical protein OPV22_031114 [Ensete ventricosum]|uniref:Uncharacterized protein n=1 Tax=Ensete ventricosum TaxID=4639 RepID=A0AAV8PNS2_ENSVE|nr:hypothetical protein OPV22_031114 [Ensete ventricosum]